MVPRAAETHVSIRNYAQGTAGPQHMLIKSNHYLTIDHPSHKNDGQSVS